MPPRLSVVVPTRDTRELTIACLAAVASWPEAEEVVVVDDGGRDGTLDAVERRFPSVARLANPVAEGFTRAANRGLAAAGGDLVLLLNSDTEVEPGGGAALLAAFAAEPRLGVAGALLHFPDGRPQWSGGREPGLAWFFALASGWARARDRLRFARRVRPVGGHGGRVVDWVPATAMTLRRELLAELGPFDERFALYAQDLDFCLRARDRGWRVRVCAGARVRHRLGSTIATVEGRGPVAEERLRRDLLAWAEKRRGAAWAARVERALDLGTRLAVPGRLRT
ncbi:MAG: glycosyltransferase [Thermoanaerobaculia bacterium]